MNWWQYLLLANVYLILFYGFYALMLRHETFFQLNRVYLIGSALLSFLIPLIQAEWVRNLFITQRINQTIYRLDTVTIYNVRLQPDNGLTLGQGFALVYLAGSMFLLLRFLFQLATLRRYISGVSNSAAFSFFKRIKLSDELINRDIILAHEQVHARQWHSADVLLIELMTIINWFNPVAYLYSNAIKHIHEFIADRDVINIGADKQEYALLLLSETFKAPVNQLVNPFFNHSLLKQRIVMLQKNHSRRTALLKYGLSAPLFALMVILSSATIKTNRVITRLSEKATEVMQTPANAANIKQLATLKQKDAPPIPAIMGQPGQKHDFYTSPENSAEFPGGMDAFGAFLAKNIIMSPALKATLPQKPVIVQFIVEKDGSLSDIHILRGGGPTAAEAMRVLALSPKWNPGKHDGKVVRQQYTVPIQFTLEGGQKVGLIEIKTGERPLFTSVEQSAEFPGGLNEFGKFLGKNIKITPEMKIKMPLQKVICQFVVEEDGELTDVKILRGSGSTVADAEALRVLALSPKWTPGMQNGRTVRQQYTIPIGFTADAPQKVGMADNGKKITLKTFVFRDTVKLRTGLATANEDIIPNAVYYINGQRMDKALFSSIDPNTISRLSVVKRASKDSIKYDIIMVEIKDYIKTDKH